MSSSTVLAPCLVSPGSTIDRLVYVEFHDTIADAALREKQMKRWKRAWKLSLIERDNPQWRDLYEDLPM